MGLFRKNKGTPLKELERYHGKRVSYVVEREGAEETVIGRKSPRSSNVKSRQGNYFPYLLFYFLHGIPKILFFIPKISAESQINFCHYLSKISIASPYVPKR